MIDLQTEPAAARSPVAQHAAPRLTDDPRHYLALERHDRILAWAAARARAAKAAPRPTWRHRVAVLLHRLADHLEPNVTRAPGARLEGGAG